MEYEDLTLLTEGHAQSAYGPLPGSGWLPPGTKVYAVGWLETPGFASGAVPNDCVDRLVAAYQNDEIIRDGMMGFHSCTMCEPGQWEEITELTIGGKTFEGRADHPFHEWRGNKVSFKGHGHHLLEYKEAVYICPVLIVHYILEHRYRLPDRFLDAVRHGVFLTEDDLIYTREARLARAASRLSGYDPRVDTGLGEVAEEHLEAREFDDAESLYMSQRDYRARVLGVSHPSVGESEESMARVRKQRGQAIMAQLSSSWRKPGS